MKIGYMVFESWDEHGYRREVTPIFDEIPKTFTSRQVNLDGINDLTKDYLRDKSKHKRLRSFDSITRKIS